MLHYINKDITTVEKGVIAHGVNCMGKMGSGVAFAIRRKWPIVFEKYSSFVIANNASSPSASLLGRVQFTQVGLELVVANCFTQIFYGRGAVHAIPEAIKQSLTIVCNFANHGEFDLYIPKIGAGLGGLNWERDVEPIVKKLADENENVDIYVCFYGE